MRILTDATAAAENFAARSLFGREGSVAANGRLRRRSCPARAVASPSSSASLAPGCRRRAPGTAGSCRGRPAGRKAKGVRSLYARWRDAADSGHAASSTILSARSGVPCSQSSCGAVDAVREARVRSCVRRGSPFGDTKWVRQIAVRLSVQSTPSAPGTALKMRPDPFAFASPDARRPVSREGRRRFASHCDGCRAVSVRASPLITGRSSGRGAV